MKGVLTLLLSALLFPAAAQVLKGKVFSFHAGEKEILPGAQVRWIGSDTAAEVNENGVFELSGSGISDKRIVSTAPFHKPDTSFAGARSYISITLRRTDRELGGITVSDRSSASISRLSTAQTEVITRQELSKAACCDLAGCFGTQASVQPQTTNVVTNAQELRILGLSGVYNQVLIDGLPLISGLSYTYGISSYPGTVIDNIYVSKGTTSVLQGYESISGQINLESRKPEQAERLHLNAYINSFGEKHLNANLAFAAGKKKQWRSLLALHNVQPAGRTDGNKDGFLDLPLLTRYMLFNKWTYGQENRKGIFLKAAWRLVHEQRIGGQNAYGRSDTGSTGSYGQYIRYTQPELSVKTGYRFSAQHALLLSLSGFLHEQVAWFGTTRYTAQQQTGYLNVQHEWQWLQRQQLKYGFSYRYQELSEQVGFRDNTLGRTFAGDYLTRLRVPGFFAENTFRSPGERFVLITGLRADHHQQWGWYLTPRSMLKYTINPQHTLRVSAGTGWRQVNLFSEQINLLASSRDIIFAETLRPEAAVNWGISHTWRFQLGSNSGSLSADYYGTSFSNQFFPDYDTDPTRAIIRNFEGRSRSNGIQAELNLVFFRQLECRTAYNYLDVYRRRNDDKTVLPFNPRNRAMAALSYSTRNKRWQLDLNTHWFDRMRLPDTRSNPDPYSRPLWSSPYLTVNTQLSFRWKSLDVYGGCENTGNYRQPDPIIAANNPFSKYFDLSSVWGPTRGREFYLGVRYSIR